MDILFVLILGLVVGSFLGAYSYRYPRGKSVSTGRSACPKCGKTIHWYHNIPLLSYFYLRGRCASCGKRISVRYPLIELSSGVIFTVVYLNYSWIVFSLPWVRSLGIWGLPFLLLLMTALIAVVVVDLESQLIPDEVTFGLMLFIFLGLIGADINIYKYLMAGFGASVFLLAIHLVTMGKGMGLGDVKLAVPLGMMVGPKLAAAWMFGAFVIGGVAGVILLLTGAVAWRSKVAFGPFLVVSFFVTLFWGNMLVRYVLPV